MNKLIELWKNDCEDCEAAKPTVADLEKEGFEIEKYNIEESKGRELWEAYSHEIDQNSIKQNYETGYIYTPTFINPYTRKVLAYADHPPTKEELKKLAES